MSKHKVDMTGVEAYTLVGEGLQPAIIEVFKSKPTQTGTEMLVGTFKVLKGESKDGKVFENFPLTPNALWKLKALLVALGKKADGKVLLDTAAIEGNKVKIDVVHEEYEGKKRAKIAGFEPYASTTPAPEPEPEVEEEDDDEDPEVEETPAQKKKRLAEEKKAAEAAAAKKAEAAAKKKKTTVPEPESEDDDDDDDGWGDEDDD